MMQTFDDMVESVVQNDLTDEQRAYWGDVIAGASHVPVAPEACLSHEEYWSRLTAAVKNNRCIRAAANGALCSTWTASM